MDRLQLLEDKINKINNQNKIRQKRFYKKNKEKINEKKRLTETTRCPCKGRYKPHNKTLHIHTKKHKKYLEDNIKDDIDKSS